MRYDNRSWHDRPTSRREFLRLAAWGGGLLLVPVRFDSLSGSSIDIRNVTEMEFGLTCTTKVMNLPSESRSLRIWIPVPPASEDQVIRDFSISSPLPYDIRTEKVFGNKIAFIETRADTTPFQIVSRYRIVRHQSVIAPASLTEEEKQKYLTLTSRVKVTDDIRTFTNEVVGGESSPMAVGKRVFSAINEILFYDKKIPGCGTGDTEWIFRNRRGKCDDYHSLFMAMMISRGIPVRWEQGFPLPYPSEDQVSTGTLEGDCSGAHCWVSFYDRDVGWIPVDVSEADKHPELADFFFGNLSPNRFKISEGRDIVLDPGQSGEPLNSLAYAYAESDGIPLIYKANYENTIEYEVTRIETG